MNKGTVKWFNAQKGYGFITNESTGEDVFSTFFRNRGRRIQISLKKDRTLLSISQKETADFRLLM